MGREIKFRVFSKASKKMMRVTASWIEDLEGGKDQDLFKLFEGYGLVLMQYTGVNTPDGTEVYEGDIVESRFCSQTFTSEVVFNNGSFDIFLPEPHKGLLIKLAHGRDDIKVIGNIFTNPPATN